MIPVRDLSSRHGTRDVDGQLQAEGLLTLHLKYAEALRENRIRRRDHYGQFVW